MLIDTGSSINIIDLSSLEKIKKRIECAYNKAIQKVLTKTFSEIKCIFSWYVQLIELSLDITFSLLN